MPGEVREVKQHEDRTTEVEIVDVGEHVLEGHLLSESALALRHAPVVKPHPLDVGVRTQVLANLLELHPIRVGRLTFAP